MNEPLILSEQEARVLAVLIEKEATTPDVYPMTVNAVTAGCNQKSSREPVMSLSEHDVQRALSSLLTNSLVTETAGSRVPRFEHRLASRLFGKMEFDARERALLAVLMLRGPQTPGELRSRSTRLHGFDSPAEVESVLRVLMERDDGPFVVELEREPGRRETRFAHLLCGVPDAAARPAAALVGDSGRAPAPSELDALRAEVASLRERVAALEAALGVEWVQAQDGAGSQASFAGYRD